MFSKTIMGSGAILMAIVVSLTNFLAWPSYLHYIWAVVIAVWGIISFVQK